MITVRKARKDDLHDLIFLLHDDKLGSTREAQIQADKPDPGYEAAFDVIDPDPNQYLAVAELDGEIVGSLQITIIPGLSRKGAVRGHLQAMRIAREKRGQGLGRQLMEWAIAYCEDRGCKLIQLASDKSREEAHEFYDSLGFTASHEGYRKPVYPKD